MFEKYHEKYPSHGYRWLNAKILLDTGQKISDQYAHRCCKYAGIKSKSKHYAYKKSGEKGRKFENKVLASLNIDAPYQVIVSDMTAFWAKNIYRKLTLYMDLRYNEIVGYGLSLRRGDPNTYYEGLTKAVEKIKGIDNLEIILHTDRGSVYSSKSYNELLPLYHIKHSMSCTGTPTDNANMESINGWLKEELFTDFKLKESDDVKKSVEEYIQYFNKQRPAYALNYLTPKQFKEKYYNN